MKRLCFTMLGAFAIAAFGTGCVAESAEPVDVENVDTAGMSWDEFMSVIYQEPDTGIYIVNGDEAIETRELLENSTSNTFSKAPWRS